jgi:hypothetical protein
VIDDGTSDNCTLPPMGPCVPVTNNIHSISFSSMLSFIHTGNLLLDSDTSAGISYITSVPCKGAFGCSASAPFLYSA